MRWVIILVAIVGVVAAALALHEHYRIGASPCSVNEKWDCGTVNKSPYAVVGGLLEPPGPGAHLEQHKGLFALVSKIPVADIGIVGYVLLALLAFKRWWPALVVASVGALAFSLYLAHVEKDILGIWCIYCVISLGAISVLTLLSVAALVVDLRKRQPAR